MIARGRRPHAIYIGADILGRRNAFDPPPDRGNKSWASSAAGRGFMGCVES